MAVVQKRKIQGVIFLLSVVLYFNVLPAQAQYGGGIGTAEEPYLIYTAEQMNAIGAKPNNWDKHFKLMADIDLNAYPGTSFNIIGNSHNSFRGVFDDNGHTISNFSYTSKDKDRIGLFGYINDPNAQIKNLGLINPNIDAGRSPCFSIASLVGENYGTITNCYVKGGSVAGDWDVGGLVGANYGAIIDCHSTASAMGTNGIGGLVGWSYEDSVINKCYSMGNVQGRIGSRYIGGLAGGTGAVHITIFGIVRITNCYSASLVTGTEEVGGLIGWNTSNLILTNCYSVGKVTGTTNVGGLIGENEAVKGVLASFWDIQTSGQSSSDGGMGKTTDEMQTTSTFLEAGWDFADEIENGTEDIWWILEGQSYPRLWWQYGLAFSPRPQDGAIYIVQPVILNWLPGGSDLSHDVYFGEDVDSVANATIESPDIYRGRLPVEVTTFNLGKLALDTTYYWRIDEVNEADLNSPWKGSVWSFTTGDFFIVDDFESYNDLDPECLGSNRIWDTWIDGFDNPMINGSIVGYVYWWREGIKHGGAQSMPFSYNNAVGKSEATANIDNLAIGRDWTIEGVAVLSLWFKGFSDNTPELMYVALANSDSTSVVVYHDNPEVALIDTWTEYRIDLQLFADQGVDLTNVNTISIGFSDKNNPQSGGSGKLWFDDIRLYRPTPKPAL